MDCYALWAFKLLPFEKLPFLWSFKESKGSMVKKKKEMGKDAGGARHHLVYVWIAVSVSRFVRPTFFSGSHVLFTRFTNIIFQKITLKMGPINYSYI